MQGKARSSKKRTIEFKSNKDEIDGPGFYGLFNKGGARKIKLIWMYLQWHNQVNTEVNLATAEIQQHSSSQASNSKQIKT